MVEENFKIGISLELEQSSLADLEKQIAKAVKNATNKAMKGANLGSAGPSSATVRGAAGVVNTSGNDFAKAVKGVLKSEFASFNAASQQISSSMDRLTAALNKQQSGAAPAKQSTSAPIPISKANAGRQKAVDLLSLKAEQGKRTGTTASLKNAQKAQDKLTKIITQKQRLEERSRSSATKAQASTENLIKANNELAAATRKRAADLRKLGGTSAGGASVSGGQDPLEKTKARRTVGGTQQNQKQQTISRLTTGGRQQAAGALVTPRNKPTTTGDGPTDSPGRRQKAAKQVAAKETPPTGGTNKYQIQAKQDAKNIADTLTTFAKQIESALPSFKGTDLRRELGLPSGKDVNVRPGAVPTVKSPGGQEAIAGTVVKIMGTAVSRMDRITSNLQGVEDELKQIAARGARHGNRDRTKQELRQLVKKRVFDDSQKYQKNQSMGQFIRGGESKLIMKPTQEQASRIESIKAGPGSESAKIAEVEAILHDLAKSSDDFAKAGLDVVSLLGLTEEAAAKLAVQLVKTEAGFEGTISGKVQTRNIQGIQPGGPGFVKQARSLYLKSASKITGGEEPEIKSTLEKIAYADGLFTKAAKNLVTAAVSFKHIPEVLEDQILIAKSAAKDLGMFKEKSSIVKDVDESLVVGMGLQQGQTLGLDAEGKKVKMALDGASAEITKLEPVFINGVKMLKITFDELNDFVTGSKIGTRAGHKGLAKVIPDEQFAKMGLPKGTQAAASIEGFMKRGDLQDIIAMISTSMSDGGKIAAQVIFDKITDAMKSGTEMFDAVTNVAGELGLDANAALKPTSGALKAGGVDKVLSGRLSMLRFEKEGQTGEANVDERFVDPTAMQALKQRQETLAWAMAAEQRSRELVIPKQKDYINALMQLTGASKTVTAGLQKIKPEEISALPTGMLESEQIAGTLSDKDFLSKAINLQMPARGGGFEDMYVPSIGGAVGQRGGFVDESGQFGADKLTKGLEQLRRQAVQIKAARGDIDPGSSPEAASEVASFASNQLNKQIAAITAAKEGGEAGGAETSASKALAKTFKETWMPLVNKMEQQGMGAGIGFQIRGATGRERAGQIKDKPSVYANKGKDSYQQSLRIRDMLGVRSESPYKRAKGSKEETRSIGSLGALFDVENVELLKSALENLGTTAGEDAEFMDKLWSRFEKLKVNIVELYAEMGAGRNDGRPSREEMRKVAQTRGSGISPAPYAKAVEFSVDVSSELKQAEEQLNAIGKSGKNVGGALEALERIKSIQVSEDAMPRDAVMLSKEDYANMIKMVKRTAKDKGENLSDSEARSRLDRGIIHRDPTTGGASFQVAKILEDKKGLLPEGQVGIPGSFGASSTADLKKMRGPLEEFRDSLIKTVKANNGHGAVADEARSKISELNKVISGLTQTFDKAMMNLDFDGDAIKVHAALSKEAAQDLLTVQEIMSQGGTSLQAAMRGLIGGLEGGSDNDFQSLKGIDNAFGKLVKRPAGMQSALPMPDDSNTARIEASALVSAKHSVGLLSDAFNILQGAIIGGSKQTGDAFSTAMEQTMLNINKSLAAKHGTGDVTGPMQFVDDLKSGPEGLKKIFEGMDAGGDGLYGDLGGLNKDYRKQIENQLMTQSPAQLMEESMKQGLMKEGDTVDSSNFNSVIKNLVDRMDLKSQIKVMWEMLESNMRESMAQRGFNPKAIDSEIKKATTRGEKGIPGLDLAELTPDAYSLTRRKGVKELNKQDPTDKLRTILQAVQKQTSDGMTRLEIEPDGAKAAGQTLSSKVETWLAGIRHTYEIINDDLLKAKGFDPSRVTGMFDDSTGGEGTVMVSESQRQRPAMAAVDALKKIETGQLSATPKLINFIIKSLANLGKTLSHEGIHKGARQFTDSVDNISTALLGTSGPFGKAKNQILQLADQLQNVKGEGSKSKQLRQMNWERPDTQVGKAEGLEEYASMNVGDAMAQQSRKYMALVAEELMAHLASPERWQSIFGDLPAEVGVAVMTEMNRMRTALPAMIDPIQDGISQLNMGIVEAYMGAIKNQGASAGAVKGMAESQIGDIQWPGYQDFTQKTQVLGKAQEALSQGRTENSLTPGKNTGGKISAMGAVNFKYEAEFEASVISMRGILEEMGEAVDPEKLAGLRSQFRTAAETYRDAIKSKGGSNEQAGFKEFKKAMQEFQAHELQMYINKARNLQNVIAKLRQAGQHDTTEFSDKIEEFDNSMVQIFATLGQLRIPGAGAMSGIAATASGQQTIAAGELGIKPGQEQYSAVLKRQEMQSDNFKPMSASLDRIKDEIKEGKNSTVAWAEIWDEVIQSPATMVDNLQRVSAVMSEFAKLAKFEVGGEAELSLKAIGEEARTTAKELERMGGVKTGADLATAIGGSKKVKGSSVKGKGLAESIKQQMADAERQVQVFQGRLNDVLAQGVDLPGRNLQGPTIDIMGDNNQVLKKFRIEGKKTGKVVTASLRDITKATDGVSGSMRSALRRVVQWGFATGIVYGTMRAFRAAGQTITEVEDRITALKKVMDTSVTNFTKMQDSAVGFAKEFGVAIEDVLDGMVVYGQQGLKMGKIMERTRATMLAVNVTTLSATDATEALTASHKVFGDQISESTGFVDAWAAVAARHAITAKDLADAVKRSGAAAGVAGVGFNDFMGIVTAIGAVTRQTGKEIATSTKFMFRAMRRPTAQKELGKMGIQSLTPGDDFKPAVDILKQVAGQWDGMTRAQQVNLAQSMAGIRHYNSFIVLMNNFDEALLASADAANSQGFAMRKNRLSMQTFSKNMTVLKESVRGLALELGKTLLPFGTGFIEIMSGMASAAGALPSSLMTALVGVTGLGLGVHKFADIISDSMDAMSTGQVSSGPKSGFFKSLQGTGKKAAAGLAAAGDTALVAGASKDLTKTGKAAFFAKKGLMGLASAFGLVGTAAGGAILAGIVVALGGMAYWYSQATKSAKEYEQEQEGVTGRSEDAASALRSQSINADRLALSFAKIGEAQKVMSDPTKLQAALKEGKFKSTAKAAQTYANMLADISHSIGTLDPSKIRGITESGDFITGIESNFKALTMSALDAQNAITASLKVDVIKEFAKELKTPEGILNNIKQGLANFASTGSFSSKEGETAEFSPLGKLAEVRKEIKKITDQMREQEQLGNYSIAGQEALNKLVAEEGVLREGALEAAKNIRRVLESIPTFENLDMAMASIDAETLSGIGAAASTGAFGRGATESSVMTQFMAKQVGLGGIVDQDAAQSPGLTAGAFLERGIGGASGAAAVRGTDSDTVLSGEIAFLSKQARDELTNGVGTVFSAFDVSTGDVVYKYFDRIGGALETISGEAVETTVARLEKIDANVDHFLRIKKGDVTDAVEHTKKILTMQFSGAMAGIRIPTGGAPNLGPARDEELSAEQRVLKSMPEDMQRLADVQAEFNALTKQYSEDILTDVEGAYKRQAKSGQALKVMTQEILVMATQLQQEGHMLTVMGNYQKLQEQLTITLKQSAEAARDAANAEENRAKFIKVNAGSMSGMGVLPSLDLGKSMRELGSQERLAQRDPSIEKLIRRIGATETKRDAAVDNLNEIQKAMANFDDAAKDMAAAGDSLSSEQKSRFMKSAAKGVGVGEQAMIKALMSEGKTGRDLMKEQVNVQERIVDEIGLTNELLAAETADDRRDVFQKAMGKADYKQLAAAFATTSGQDQLQKLVQSTMGISRKDGTGKFETNRSGDINADRVADFLNKMDTMQAAGVGGASVFAEGKTFQMLDKMFPVLNKLLTEVIGEDPGRLKTFREEYTSRTQSSDFMKEVNAGKIKDKAAENELLSTRMNEQKIAGSKTFLVAQAEAEASIHRWNAELSATKPGFAMAVAIETFAKSLEDIALDMDKTALLGEDIKIKSDLDGPFSRVGNPDFLNQFEQRRKDIESGSNRPMTLEAMRARDTERKSIKFDEKEAKNKQKQDIEVAALRQIQSQANQVRDVLATTALDPNMDAGTQRMAENFLRTLNDEMATSEQATERSGELFFKGIPSLDNLQDFVKQMKGRAQETAKSDDSARRVADYRAGNKELFSLQSIEHVTSSKQLAELQAIRTLLAAAGKDGTVSISDADIKSQVAISAVKEERAAGTISSSQAIEKIADVLQSQAKAQISATSSGQARSGRGDGAVMAGATAGFVASMNPSAAQGTDVIQTRAGKVVNTVQKIGDDLVVAASHLNGQIVGLQEFDVVSEGGTKSLRARHISGSGGTGVDLLPDMQGQGVGSGRLAEVMKYGTREGFDALESSDFASASQTGAYQSAARKTGLSVANATSDAGPALSVDLQAGPLSKLGKGLGVAGAGIDAYQMTTSLMNSGAAQTPEEAKYYSDQLGGQLLGTAGVASMVAAGTATGGVPGGILAGAVGVGGMVADSLTGAGSLDYAASYWDKQTGGRFGNAVQGAGEFLGRPGNYFGDKAFEAKTAGIPAVGNSNSNLEMQRQQRKTGNASALPGGIITTDAGAPGTNQTSAAARVNSTGDTGSSGTADAVSSLSTAIESLNTKIDSLGEIKLPDSLRTSLDGVNAAVTNLSSSTLNVSVVDTVPVTVANTADFPSSTDGGGVTLGDLSSAVVTLSTTVSSLEGFAGTDGILKQDIESLGNRLTTNEDTSTEQSTKIGGLETTVDGFETTLTSTTDTATAAKIESAEALECALSAEADAAAATALAGTSEENAATALTNLNTLKEVVEGNKQNIESQVRVITTEVDTTTKALFSNTARVGGIEKLAQNADTKAAHALSLAQSRS